MIGRSVEGCQNALKQFMCSVTSFYNGMYTVCSYDAPQKHQKHDRYNLCARHLQVHVIVKSNEQHIYL